MELVVAVYYDVVLLVWVEVDGFVVYEVDYVGWLGLFVGYVVECRVVEDVAVLVDLDERGVFVIVGGAERFYYVLVV